MAAVFFMGPVCLFTAWAGTIRTAITTHTNIKDQKELTVTVDVQNKGDATAYEVTGTLLSFPGTHHKHKLLHENPPGGKVSFREQMDVSTWLPGRYYGVVRIDFEEQNGTPHFARHVFDVTLGPASLDNTSGQPLTLKVTAPEFNRKAFRKKSANLRLTIRNHTSEPIPVTARIVLPEGFESPQPIARGLSASDKETVLALPVDRLPASKNGRKLQLLVDYEWKGRHYSKHVERPIRVVQKPVYFKWYLVLGLTIMGIALLGWIVYGRRRRSI